MELQPPAAVTQAGVTVQCRFFGRFAEALGTEAVSLEVPPGATVGDVVAALRRRLESAHAIPEHPLVAVNREQVSLGRPVQAGDEVAFLPPLAGG